MKDGCTDDIIETKLHWPVLQCSGNSKNLDCMLQHCTFVQAAAFWLTVSGRWWVWPDGTSPSKHLVSIITAMMDGDDVIGDDDGGHNDHGHSQDCDDATADATWHSWYCQLLCHSQMAPMITACILKSSVKMIKRNCSSQPSSMYCIGRVALSFFFFFLLSFICHPVMQAYILNRNYLKRCYQIKGT